MVTLHRLSRVIAVPLGPVILTQGRRLRRDTPRLPDAAQPWSGTIDGPDPLRVLVIGDSTAAGVGVEHQRDGLVGQVAAQVAARSGRGVEWRAMGENGGTARDLVRRYLDDAIAEPFDVIFVSIGANDALALRSRGAFASDLRRILTAFRERNPHAIIVMSSLPAFFRFTLLPEPLRWSLYLHSQSLERAARSLVSRMPGVVMSPPPPPYTEGFFASDLFHPGAQGYREWAEFAIDDLEAQAAPDWAALGR